VLAGAQQTLPKLDRLLHEILCALAQPANDRASADATPANSANSPPIMPDVVPDSADGRRGTFIIRTIKPPL